ncbi:MAG: hypothetical protein JRD00_05015 [Deltaproteobacteria bacterium]|nr:hypothetical protein [Deltaproteobacteria bacterium]
MAKLSCMRPHNDGTIITRVSPAFRANDTCFELSMIFSGFLLAQEYRGSNDDLAFRVRSIQPVARPGGGMTSGSTGFYEASWVVKTGARQD